MPVDFEAYALDSDRIDLTDGTNAHRLVSVLLEHPGIGFTSGELHEQTDIPRGSINPTLARLEAAGLVRRKGAYWSLVDGDRLAAASAAVMGLEAIAETYADDWYAQNTDWADELSDLSEE